MSDQLDFPLGVLAGMMIMSVILGLVLFTSRFTFKPQSGESEKEQ